VHAEGNESQLIEQNTTSIKPTQLPDNKDGPYKHQQQQQQQQQQHHLQ
jgi:hypothetical protein